MEEQKQEQRIAGLTKAQFEALNAEHGGSLKIYGVELDEKRRFELIARKPTQGESDQHMLELSKLKDKNTPITPAMRNFVRLVTVAPDSDALDQSFETYPMAVTQIYERVMKEIGSDAEIKELAFR